MTLLHEGKIPRFTVDAILLFQRSYVRGNTNFTRTALQYELSPFPLRLFGKHGFIRKTLKSELYKVFKIMNIQNPVEFIDHHIIDGGCLLHEVSWPHGYMKIFDIYLGYIKSNFGTNAFIVFDGYSNANICVKSYERYRRKEKKYGCRFRF